MVEFDTTTLAARANELLDRMLSGQPLEAFGPALSLKSQDTLYHLGYMQYQQARYAEAMRIFGYLLTMNHVDKRFLMGFGACLQMQRQHEEALKFYSPACVLDMTDPEPVMRCVECHLALGNVDAARLGLDYGLKQARAHAAHHGWIDRFETMLGFLDNAPAKAPATNTLENANG
ncbi:tetratricopeptide repeat protein [Caenimonas koreensis]|uniref:tetratricopeptide repeat protein n=1 Tax=Caenimonas koreensis TaxID=367474 RepID=UPI0037849006